MLLDGGILPFMLIQSVDCLIISQMNHVCFPDSLISKEYLIIAVLLFLYISLNDDRVPKLSLELSFRETDIIFESFSYRMCICTRCITYLVKHPLFTTHELESYVVFVFSNRFINIPTYIDLFNKWRLKL